MGQLLGDRCPSLSFASPEIVTSGAPWPGDPRSCTNRTSWTDVVTAPAANPGTLARSRSARGRSPGTRTSAVGRHHERMGKDVGRARIGPTDENWAGGVLPCDVVPVVREHANRHEGSEFASPSSQRWLGPGDRRRDPHRANYPAGSKSALLEARLRFLDSWTSDRSGLASSPSPNSLALCALIANTCSTGFARDTPSPWAPSRASTTRPASPRN